jgi:hypothetical protein
MRGDTFQTVLVLAQNPGSHEEPGERVTGHTYVGAKRVPITESNPDGPPRSSARPDGTWTTSISR